MIVTPIDWRSFKKNQSIHSPSQSKSSLMIQKEMEELIRSFTPDQLCVFYFNQNLNKHHIDRMNLHDLERLTRIIKVIDPDKIALIFHHFLIKGYFPYIRTHLVMKNLNYHDHIHLKKNLGQFQAKMINLNDQNVVEIDFSQNQTPINTRYLEENWI